MVGFVGDRPEGDRRPVPVALDQLSELLTVQLLDLLVTEVDVPVGRDLFPEDEPLLVGFPRHRFGVRVVREPGVVTAELRDPLEPLFDVLEVERTPLSGGLLVQRDPPEPDLLAVE